MDNRPMTLEDKKNQLLIKLDELKDKRTRRADGSPSDSYLEGKMEVLKLWVNWIEGLQARIKEEVEDMDSDLEDN